MLQQLYQTKFRSAKELNQRMFDMWHGLKPSVIDDAFGRQLRRVACHQGRATDECCKRPCICIRVMGRHF